MHVIVCLEIFVVDDCTLCSEHSGMFRLTIIKFFFPIYTFSYSTFRTGQADTTFTFQVFWLWCMVKVVSETLDIAYHPRLNTHNIL